MSKKYSNKYNCQKCKHTQENARRKKQIEKGIIKVTKED